MFRFIIPATICISQNEDIHGRLLCYDRKDSSEFQVNYSNLPSELYNCDYYEIEVSSIIPAILSESDAKRILSFNPKEYEDLEKEIKIRQDMVGKYHINIGKNLHPYLCCPRITRKNMRYVLRLWYVHLALVTQEGVDIGYVENFLTSKMPFEEWLSKAEWIKDSVKPFLHSKEAFFNEALKVSLESGLDTPDTVMKMRNWKMSFILFYE